MIAEHSTELAAEVAELMVRQAEQSRRLGLIALALLERLLQQPPAVGVDALLEGSTRLGSDIAIDEAEILGHDLALHVAIRRALDDVLQLAHVAREAVALEAIERGLREALAFEGGDLARELLEEVLRQHLDVALALAQRRYLDHLEREAVV